MCVSGYISLSFDIGYKSGDNSMLGDLYESIGAEYGKNTTFRYADSGGISDGWCAGFSGV